MAMANASVSLSEGIGPMLTGTARPAEVLAFCASFRRRGIASFLVSGDPDALMRDLTCSGQAFLHALPAIPAQAQAASELLPFFDALAADDVKCAQGIAAGTRSTWNPNEELEEDFVYMSLVMSLLSVATAEVKPELAERASRYQDLASGNEEDEDKSAIIQALIARDEDGFDAALGRRMRHIQKRYRRLAANLSVDEEEAATSGSVSVEGIALVRIGRMLGLATKTDYRLVPSLALRASGGPTGDASWRTPND
jgi:hypothetical protein